MIYPTARAVLLAALGAPIGLALGLAGGSLWLVGVAWIAAVAAAVLADGVLGASLRKADIGLTAPPSLHLGRDASAQVRVAFLRGAPRLVEVALEASERIVQPPRQRAAIVDGRGEASLALRPVRRGQARLQTLWVRWTGPLGLVFKQRRDALGLEIPVNLDIPQVKEDAARLVSAIMESGAHLQFELGGASEFHALVDYRPGMNPRMIDWKQSARHRALLAREYEAERNHHIVLAVDCGRQMCEPVEGVPRLDRVLQASLLLAFGALKGGDRAALYAFDEKPRLWTGALSGPGAFVALQKMAARIDYSTAETNYTLGLVQLGADLKRRSLVVIFTEFTDSTTAELMIDNMARLLKTHLVMFVVARDEELDSLERAPVRGAADVAKAVLAGVLAAERELVIGRLKRMGVDILETDIRRLGPALLGRYAEIKQRDLL